MQLQFFFFFLLNKHLTIDTTFCLLYFFFVFGLFFFIKKLKITLLHASHVPDQQAIFSYFMTRHHPFNIKSNQIGIQSNISIFKVASTRTYNLTHMGLMTVFKILYTKKNPNHPAHHQNRPTNVKRAKRV